MAATCVLAEGWTVEIGAVEIKGLDTITFSNEAKEADCYTKESAGMEEHQIARRGKSIVLKGKFLEDEDTGDRDAGQAAVELLAAAVGTASLSAFTITSPGGNAETFQASAQLGDLLGDVSEAAAWAVTIKRSGASS